MTERLVDRLRDPDSYTLQEDADEAANVIEKLEEALARARPYVADAVTSAARENDALLTIDAALALLRGGDNG